MQLAAARGGVQQLLLLEAAGAGVASLPIPAPLLYAARLSSSAPTAAAWQQALRLAAPVLPAGGHPPMAAAQAAQGAQPPAQQLQARRAYSAVAGTAGTEELEPAVQPATAAAAAAAEAAAPSSPQPAGWARLAAVGWSRLAAAAGDAGASSSLTADATRRQRQARSSSRRERRGGAIPQWAAAADALGGRSGKGSQSSRRTTDAALPVGSGSSSSGRQGSSSSSSSDHSGSSSEDGSNGIWHGSCLLPPATVLQDDAHPIRDADISRSAWSVLSRLRAAGHEAYMVGGTIRDLLLGGTPKDHDILTSAQLPQIKRLFSRAVIVGRAFPVCQVHAEGTIIEVSSFSTNADPRLIPSDASVHMLGRQKAKLRHSSQGGATWAAARADNAARRDFTVNGLLYDPFGRLLFDSVGGVADCAARRLRTICPPAQSFQADPARILRGVRLAARAGLELDLETARAMEEQAAGVGLLPLGRLQMEVAALLGYGGAERSLVLMWRLGLLDLLLPQHSMYLRRHRVPRAPRSPKSRRHELLFELAAELDKHVHPQRPVDSSVWMALLAAPLVAERCAQLAKGHLEGLEPPPGEHLQQAGQEEHGAEPWEQSGGLQLDGATGGGAIGTAQWLPPAVTADGGSSSSSGSSTAFEQAAEQAGNEVGSGTASGEGGAGAGDPHAGERGIDAAAAAAAWGAGAAAAAAPPSADPGLAGDSSSGAALQWPSLQHVLQPSTVGGLPPQQLRRQQYLRQYSQVVAQVLTSMQQPLQARTLSALGRRSRRLARDLQAGNGSSGSRQVSLGSQAARRHRLQEPRDGVLMPCVLPKQAADRAAALLLLEADLRGRPELQELLHKGGWAHAHPHAHPHGRQQHAQLHAGGDGSSNGSQGGLGHRHQRHEAWRRKEAGLDDSPAAAAQLEAAAAGAAPGAAQEGPAHALLQPGRRRQGKRRALSSEELLVLGILSDPRFGFAARTHLPLPHDGEEAQAPCSP